jgi:hypothetical protein
MADMRQFSIWLNSGLIALLLSGCMSAPSLDTPQQRVDAQPLSNEQYYDACFISKTGAVPNGQRLPKKAVKAIKAELARRQVDCNNYVSPTIASGGTQIQTPAQSPEPTLSFQE